MVKEVLIYPNSILRKKSKNIIHFDNSLHQLLDDMNETMLYYGGVGLAAIQIGIALNVLIINLPVQSEDDDQKDIQLNKNLIEAINPKITYKNGEQLFYEGCLSIPNFNEDIKRSMNITVEYYDRYGTKKICKTDDFLAVAWQHEIEHLNGHVFIENLSFTKRKKFEKEWKRMAKNKKSKN